MSLISEEIVDALKEMEGDMGSKTVTVNGSEYACVPTRSQSGSLLSSGGFSMRADYSFYIRRSLFETLPTVRQPVVFEGKSLKIAEEGISLSACGAYVIVTCEDPAQGISRGNS